MLSETGALHGIQYQDELIARATDGEAETKQQRFDADFLIMTGELFGLLKDLFGLLMGGTNHMDEPNGG